MSWKTGMNWFGWINEYAFGKFMGTNYSGEYAFGKNKRELTFIIFCGLFYFFLEASLSLSLSLSSIPLPCASLPQLRPPPPPSGLRSPWVRSRWLPLGETKKTRPVFGPGAAGIRSASLASPTSFSSHFHRRPISVLLGSSLVDFLSARRRKPDWFLVLKPPETSRRTSRPGVKNGNEFFSNNKE